MTSDEIRGQGVGFLRAADTICNGWNLLPRTKAWCKMTPHFQKLWKDLRAIGNQEIERAAQMAAAEQPPE